MADISVQSLDKFFGERQVLTQVSFEIFPGEKVAVVGPNGAGKTTLFKILTGELPFDSGEVSIGRGRTVGIIDQIPVYPAGATVEDVLRSAFSRIDSVREKLRAMEKKLERQQDDRGLLKQYGSLQAELEAMGGYNVDFELDKVANGLEITKEQRSKLFSVLSGGEKTRVNLARIILEDTDILLLDEPTNHLDLDAVEWLGEYLDSYQGTVVTISHDRYFLDQCCDRIIELKDGKADFYAGSYSYYAEERQRRFALQLERHERESEEVRRLEDKSRSMHEHGTEKLAKRAASIDKRIARMKVTDRPRPEKKLSMSFGDPDYETEEVFKVRGISKAYEGREILKDVTFTIRNGERVAVLGDNGTGKTTLLNIMLNLETADAGTVKRGTGLKPAYLPQFVKFQHEERSLVDTLIYDKNVTAQTARNRLGAFQFFGEDQFKAVGKLSGGEKSRLRLCELMYDPLNMLILDEPTNHLDILAREWIEEAVEGFQGTLLFVSHDRYFVSRFANRILAFVNGEFLDFAGSYEEFLLFKKKRETEAAAKARESGLAARKEKSMQAPKAKGGTKQVQKKLAAAEREIAALEEKIAKAEEQMAAQASNPERLLELMGEKEEQETLLLEKLAQWDTLASELAALTAGEKE